MVKSIVIIVKRLYQHPTPPPNSFGYRPDVRVLLPLPEVQCLPAFPVYQIPEISVNREHMYNTSFLKLSIEIRHRTLHYVKGRDG